MQDPQHPSRFGVLLALFGIGALLVGCGRTTVASAGMVGSPQATASSLATPSPSGSSSATSSPSGVLAHGQVTLTVEKPRYATGDTIVVTIHNGLAQTIWATDHQTDCTVVTAERLLESQWVAVGGCPLMTPTRVVPVADASATVRQSLNTGASTGVGPGAVAGSSWPSGTYRVTLIYTGGDDGTGGPGGVAHSATFTIG